MNMNMEGKNEKLVPNAEVVAKKLQLTEEMEQLCAQENPDRNRIAAISDASHDLDQKYNFFDQEFEADGLKGLKDISGKVLVPAMYHDFCEIYHYNIMRNSPVAAVNAENKVALVKTDGTGAPLTEFIYDNIHNVPMSRLYAAYIGKKAAILTPNGKELVPCIIDSYTELLNGISNFESDGKEGLFTTQGLYVAPQFDEVTEKDELVYVRKGEVWGFIDDEGHFIEENDEEALDDACCLSWFPCF